MKIDSVVQAVEFEGMAESKSFSIQAGAKAFEILSSTLYTNKIGAVVRETIMNALDSHIAAGKKDVPFQVHLPTQFEPYFIVRDFGTGMSHDFVMRLYSTYFASSKADENFSVGGFGLGSKSPFSYVDNFTVTVWQDGKKRNYACYKDESNCPQISLVEQIDDGGETGVEINVPAKAADGHAFAKEYKKYAKWLPVAPACNMMLDGIAQAKPAENYTFNIRQYTNVINVIVGYVEYPVTIESLNAYIPAELQRVISNHALTLFVDIGEVDINANREALSLSKGTRTTLIDKINAAIKQHNVKHEANIISAKTFLEAHNSYAKLLYPSNKTYSFKSRVLGDRFIIESSTDKFVISELPSYSGSRSVNYNNIDPTHEDSPYSLKIGINTTNNPIFVIIDEVPKRINRRRRAQEWYSFATTIGNSTHFMNKNRDVVLAVHAKDGKTTAEVKAELELIITEYGQGKIFLASEIPSTITAQVIKPSKRGKVVKYHTSDSRIAINFTYDGTNSLAPAGTKLVIDVANASERSTYDLSNIESLLNKYYKTPHKVIGVNARFAANIVKNEPAAITREDALTALINDFENDPAVASELAKSTTFTVDWSVKAKYYWGGSRRLLKLAERFDSKPAFAPKSKFMKKVKELRDLENSSIKTKYDSYAAACRILEVDAQKAKYKLNAPSAKAADLLAQIVPPQALLAFDFDEGSVSLEYFDNIFEKLER